MKQWTSKYYIQQDSIDEAMIRIIQEITYDTHGQIDQHHVAIVHEDSLSIELESDDFVRMSEGERLEIELKVKR
jgi:hypothetical protein